MEIEFFCQPDESLKWYEYWRDLRKNWYSTLGIKSDNLVPREQGKEELAHYSIGTTDIEYMFPFSDEPQELEGVAHRGSFDLEAALPSTAARISPTSTRKAGTRCFRSDSNRSRPTRSSARRRRRSWSRRRRRSSSTCRT